MILKKDERIELDSVTISENVVLNGFKIYMLNSRSREKNVEISILSLDKN